jgi:mono/diheme cytochrome c family protein
MKNMAWFLLGPGLFLSPAGGLADEPDTLGAQARVVLQAHCAGCHGGGKVVRGGFGFVLDRDRLVGRSLVVPGKPNQSDLFLRIQQGEMPPPARKNRPNAAEVALLKRWIEAGAPAFDPPVRAVRALAEREVAGVILADLDKLDPRRRRFARYLTLTHLAFAGRPERDLQAAREAAGKLLNSLSWHPRITLPEPMNAEGTILRIDLRAYKWNAASWEKLAAVYPYRQGTQTEAAQTIARWTGSEVAALRADWFVATAARPPFYHDLLQLPATDRGLERLLQVDVPGDIQDDSILRAGFNDSGVSKNNRLIERHDAVYGTLWRSYDFAGNTGRQNLFEHPIGPNAGATSFQPAGGEIIFHLPNGLQGYLLIDGAGRRIDKAPGEIVSDPRRPDQRVETGISCMSCHARGLLPKADQLRAHVEKHANVFGQPVVAAVRATHPRKERFQAQIEEDNVRYLKALEKFGIRDPDQEPVNLVTQRFEATLDGRTAAAELGLTVPELGQFLKQDPDLARILGGLLVSGGTVQREVFEEKFAEMSRQLRILQAAASGPNRTAKMAFTGHTGTVNAVVFAPDGKRAASGSDDRTVRLWEVAGGQELACFQGSSGEIYAVAFSRDGKLLLSAGRDKLLRLWDLQTGRQVRVFQGHTDTVRCVAFSPDGKQAVSGGDDRSLRIWNVASGEESAALAGHTAPVTSVAWSADGKHALSGSRDGTVRFWDWQGRRQLARLEGHAGPVLSVALAADGKTAVSGGNDKTVRWWDLWGNRISSPGQELHCFLGHANAVIHVQVAAAGGTVFSSSSQHRSPDRVWRRWDLLKRQETGSMTPGAEVSFGCAAFSADGRQVLAGGPGGFLRMWSW